MRKFIGVIFMLVCLTSTGQEMYRISHYSVLNTLYSPSLSVAYSGLNVLVLGRSQWDNMPGSPKTMLANITSQVLGSKFYVNGNVVVDQLSVFNNFESNLGLSYKLTLNDKNYISLGIQSGFRSMRVDLNRAVYTLGDNYLNDNLNSSVRALISPSFTYLNIPLNLTVSAGAQDVLNMKNGFLYVNKATNLGKEMFNLHTSVLLKHSFKTNRMQLDLNTLLMYKNQIGIGAGYRINNELVVMARYNFKDILQIGYSYDLGFGKIKNLAGHEVYLKYTLRRAVNSKTSGYTNPLI